MGVDGAVFEQGARHVGLDIAGKDVVNPTGAILAGAMMLRHLRLPAFADRVQDAVLAVLADRKTVTRDIGGDATTTQFVDAVVAKVQ